MQTLESAPSGFRSPFFKRGLFARDLQCWYLDLGIKICSTLLRVLRAASIIAENWFQSPQTDVWPLELPCKGLISRKVENCPKCVSKEICPPPGRTACRRRVLWILRGITQLARRLEVLNGDVCVRLLRATRKLREDP